MVVTIYNDARLEENATKPVEIILLLRWSMRFTSQVGAVPRIVILHPGLLRHVRVHCGAFAMRAVDGYYCYNMM
jgi:hypothetical protein